MKKKQQISFFMEQSVTVFRVLRERYLTSLITDPTRSDILPLSRKLSLINIFSAFNNELDKWDEMFWNLFSMFNLKKPPEKKKDKTASQVSDLSVAYYRNFTFFRLQMEWVFWVGI